MTHISPQRMIAFTDELSKVAGLADFMRTHLAGRYPTQLAVGAGLGGIGNILRHRLTDSPEQRQQSSTMGQFIRGAGAGAGIAGGRILATQAGRQAAKKGLRNLFDRERYGLTGKGLGGTPEAELTRAQELGIVGKTPTRESVLGFSEGPLHPSESKTMAGALARHGRDVGAFQEGYSSAPGMVHGMLSRPGHTLKETLGRKWQHGSNLDKAFMGLGGFSAAKGFLEKPEEGGPGRLETGLGRLGATMGYMAGPSGLVASSLMGGAGGKIGKGIGRLGDKLVSAVRPGRVVPQQELYYPGMQQEMGNVG